jgi:hypothetical protein
MSALSCVVRPAGFARVCEAVNRKPRHTGGLGLRQSCDSPIFLHFVGLDRGRHLRGCRRACPNSEVAMAKVTRRSMLQHLDRITITKFQHLWG